MFRLAIWALAGILAPFAAAQALQVTSGQYFDYYHLAYELPKGSYRVNQTFGFNDGGQFEVLLEKDAFPYAAPNCQGELIIRMPYSDRIESKRYLYLQLLSGEPVSVVLELNPYVRVLQKSPLQLELTNCNLFFRHHNGDYFGQL